MPVKKIHFALLGAALGLCAVALHYHLPARLYYQAHMRIQTDSEKAASIWLPAYRVVIDGRPIEGISDNASGLTYNPHTRTLFTVINAPPQIAELSLEGELLRKIPLEGVHDPEGITHVEDDLFALADENDYLIYYLRIDASTRSIAISDQPRLSLSLDLGDNVGFEGLSWDSVGKRLFVTKEKAPLRVLEISGLSEMLRGGPMRLNIREWKPAADFALFMMDLSSLTLHEATGHLLLLSDESGRVVEYNEHGEPVSILLLREGRHGLSRSVPQAEGIAVDDAGDLFVLSEPNLFYRFKRTSAAAWMKNTAAAPN